MDIVVKTEWRQELEQIPSMLIRGMLFGGDRFTCCDEAIILQSDRSSLIGLATIAPSGEVDGTPAIVGLYGGATKSCGIG